MHNWSWSDLEIVPLSSAGKELADRFEQHVLGIRHFNPLTNGESIWKRIRTNQMRKRDLSEQESHHNLDTLIVLERATQLILAFVSFMLDGSVVAEDHELKRPGASLSNRVEQCMSLIWVQKSERYGSNLGNMIEDLMRHHTQNFANALNDANRSRVATVRGYIFADGIVYATEISLPPLCTCQGDPWGCPFLRRLDNGKYDFIERCIASRHCPPNSFT